MYRDFTRVGAAKTPHAKTMGRWGMALGPEVIKQIHERMVKMPRDNGLVEGPRMRVDITVVETRAFSGRSDSRDSQGPTDGRGWAH
jgi:transposase, IS5 family